MEEDFSHEVTEILGRIGRGSDSAAAELLPLLYNELRALAGSYFRGETPNHTLQPTAVVHEAFIKLTGAKNTGWENRAHFFAVAAKAMRQILFNHAKAKKAAKRGGGKQRVTLSGLATPSDIETEIDLIDLDKALTMLAELSPRKARIVELRFLAGLKEDEIAHVLGISTSTIQREWRMARAFLECELSGDSLS
ncbi:MAG: sigma-70 family RNA polymerase sigma factor [Planctomycetota bacterium]